MNARIFVVAVYVIAFLLAVWAVLSIPWQAWMYIALWQQTLFGFYLLMGFCGVLIAYWVYRDGEELAEMREEEMREERAPRTEPDKDFQHD